VIKSSYRIDMTQGNSLMI